MVAPMQHELGPFTVADWHALPPREDGSRLELIEGYWLVTPAPSGQHQWAESELIGTLKSSLRQAGRSDLYALGGVGVEINAPQQSALIPDFLVLGTPPVGNSFRPEHVLLAGEIWSPGNTFREKQDKFTHFAAVGVPFFWSITQDRRGPDELTAYRLEDGHYEVREQILLSAGRKAVTTAPVPVELDIADLRL
ncbi:Uma2 family endonuclease [Saccharopolyspora gloriosae]|uniref:Uma2 family endonuclease n=1 Tax=Saccharopolyspora gloriosae TaxID=455344 RepID=UPI001FB7E563|nr:Uma2 family endonuclease [Saccharopolyspora gloriosae]